MITSVYICLCTGAGEFCKKGGYHYAGIKMYRADMCAQQTVFV